MAKVAMSLRVVREGQEDQFYRPRRADGKWKGKVNGHGEHAGCEASDLTAEALGFAAEGRRVNDWLAKHLPSQTVVDTANGKGTGDGRREPVADLPGVSLKVRRLRDDGGSRSSKLTLLCEQSARGLIADLRALHEKGRDVPVVTLLLPQDASGEYTLDAARVHFHVGYPYREFAATGFEASVARARGKVGRAPKGTVLPDTWITHEDTTCTDGSWRFVGAHPRTHAPSEWEVGTMDEVRALIAGLMYE